MGEEGERGGGEREKENREREENRVKEEVS